MGNRLRASALVLAFFVIATAAIARGAGWQKPWPDMTGSSSYAFAATRLEPPQQVITIVSADQSRLSQIFFGTPNYAVSHVRFLYVNFYVLATGVANPEQCPGNPTRIDFATVFGTASPYPVTFGQGKSTTIPDCGFIWSDDLTDGSGNLVTLSANSVYSIRTSDTHAIGQIDIGGIRPQLTGTATGDGLECTTSPQNKATTGTVTVSGVCAGGTSVYAYHPAAMVAQGWDGVNHVYVLLGDSICNGQNDIATDARGQVGYVQRALDDNSTTNRIASGLFCASGTQPSQQSSIATGQFKLRLQTMQFLPNKPFNAILSEMGQNDLTSPPTLALFQAYMGEWWNFWNAQCTSCKFIQTTFAPRVTTALNNSKWTDLVNQSPGASDTYPTGVRWTAYAWMTGGVTLPSFVAVVPVTTGFSDVSRIDLWNVPSGSWTLASGVAINAASMSITGSAPPAASGYCIDAGTANVECFDALTVTGAGPYTVTFAQGLKAAKTHSISAPVVLQGSIDGTHSAHQNYIGADALLVAAKLAGTID